jgi:hypothetical protein
LAALALRREKTKKLVDIKDERVIILSRVRGGIAIFEEIMGYRYLFNICLALWG